MKLNRKLVLILALVLSLAMATTGTLAYLTDRDSEVNTFTVGDVRIDLEEDFIQDSELLPGNKVPKETFITNTGDSDAYVWMTMAIPAALDNNDTSTVGEKNALHWNVPGAVWDGWGNKESWITKDKVDAALENGWITEEHIDEETGFVKEECLWIVCQEETSPVEIGTEVIDGVTYNVYTFLYNGVLASGDTTPVALHQVYLDTKIDVDTDGKWYLVNNGEVEDLGWTNNDKIKVIVSAYGIQSEGLTDLDKSGKIDVVDAYKLYTQQWGTNGTEYNGNDKGETEEPTVTPVGTLTVGYTDTNRIWGEGTHNATESFVVKAYAGATYMGESSLTDVSIAPNITWSIYLDEDKDSYWPTTWVTAPTANQHVTRVELWVDGVQVAESNVKLNSPDDLKPITGAVVDANGKVLRYVQMGVYELGTGEVYVPFN